MPNEQLEQLLSSAQAGKRVCPVPQKWNIVAETNEEVDPNLVMTCNYYRY